MGITTNLLAILALLLSTISLVVSLIIAWPNYKESFAKIRDAVLWVAFLFVVVGMANHAWRTMAWSETKPDTAAIPPSSPSRSINRDSAATSVRPASSLVSHPRAQATPAPSFGGVPQVDSQRVAW